MRRRPISHEIHQRLPERNATFVAIGAGFLILFLSFRWLFFVQDNSTFLIYFFVSGIFFILAHLLEKQDYLVKKVKSIDERFDSFLRDE